MFWKRNNVHMCIFTMISKNTNVQISLLFSLVSISRRRRNDVLCLQGNKTAPFHNLFLWFFVSVLKLSLSRTFAPLASIISNTCYLELLLSRTFWPVPSRFEITSVDCNLLQQRDSNPQSLSSETSTQSFSK